MEYAGDRPAFCGYCGKSLSVGNIHEAATQDYSADRAMTADEIAPPEATVPGYRLVRELGRGGMGIVWEAEQVDTGRAVALKLLSPNLPHTPETMERFLREGRLAAALSHPRSTFVFGAGFHDGRPYIAMELMIGRTLKDVIEQEGPLPVQRAVDYILDVIEGLEAAHAIGVIHRDVKPSNCFLDGDGRVKVGDFGLSKSLVQDAHITRTGAFLGTPQFAAPEQVRGEPVDVRTDVYAVGATLFCLLSRRAPFAGDPAAVIAQIASDPAPRVRSIVPHVPDELDDVVARSLEKGPADRFQDLTELRIALRPFASGGTVAAPLASRLGAFVTDVLVAGSIGSALLAIGALLFGFSGVEIVAPARGAAWAAQGIELLGVYVSLVGYFGIAEGRWGRGLGKRWLGLRVESSAGGPPGFARAFVRALILPGLMAASTAVLLVIIWWLGGSPAGESEFTPVRLLLRQIVGPLLFAPLLLCLIPMREANGYRGWHEWLSGTRVVAVRGGAAASPLREVPVVEPQAVPGQPGRFGPYRTTGVLGKYGNITVLEARDDALERPVWIYLRRPGAPPLAGHRVGLARPTRPRWLQGEDTREYRWDAFEAAVGSPLLSLVRGPNRLGWDRARFVLRDLSEELAASIDDESVPSPLDLEQIWISRGGRARLVEVPVQVGDSQFDHMPGAATLAPEERAAALVRAATVLCCAGQVLPGHAQEFLARLQHMPDDRGTIDWAVGQLRRICERSSSLRRADRLVAIGLALGVEQPVYQLLAALAAIVLGSIAALPLSWCLVLVSFVALLVPTAGAAWFQGGAVFQMMGIEVRRGDGRVAGPWRWAWRGLTAWAPWMIGLSILLLWPAIGSVEAVPGGDALVWAAWGLLMVQAAGAAYAVLHPQRGIQDYVAATRIAPR